MKQHDVIYDSEGDEYQDTCDFLLDLEEDLELFEELQDDEHAKKTMLMKYLFYQRFLDFSDDIMRIYYIWDKAQRGNEYQKMCRFIDLLSDTTGPLQDITKIYK